MNNEKIAKQAYDAYGSVTYFKNYQGLPMPTWEALPETIKKAWIAATNKVLEVAENLDTFYTRE